MSRRKIWIHPAAESETYESVTAAIASLRCAEIVDERDEADIVVVIVGDPARADGGLRDTLAGAADGRFRVIGVYASGDSGELPVAVADTQTGLLPLDLELLDRVICCGERIRQDGDGGVYVPPETERHCGKRGC